MINHIHMHIDDFKTETNALTLTHLKRSINKHNIKNLIDTKENIIRFHPVTTSVNDKYIFLDEQKTGYNANDYKIFWAKKKKYRFDNEYSNIQERSVSLIVSGQPRMDFGNEHKHWYRILEERGVVVFLNTYFLYPDPRQTEKKYMNGCYTVLTKRDLAGMDDTESYRELSRDGRYVKCFPDSIPAICTNENTVERNRNHSPFSLTYIVQKFSNVGDTVVNPFEMHSPLKTVSRHYPKNLYRSQFTTESEIGKVLLNYGRKYIGFNSCTEKSSAGKKVYKYYKSGETALDKYGFIYMWFDRSKRMFYIGKHWGTEYDGYTGSGVHFTSEFKKRRRDFKRRVLSRHFSIDDMDAEEQRLLRKITDMRKWRKYYNVSGVDKALYNY